MEKNAKIFITGANGFLGRHLVKELNDCGYENLLTPTIDELDLMNAGDLALYMEEYKPDVIIHLAAIVGGIGANRDDPGGFFYHNMQMGMNLINGCIIYDIRTKKPKYSAVDRFVFISTTCAYPHTPPKIPFREEDLWEGYPEPTNAPYAIAKKALGVMGRAYRDQYKLDFRSLIPTNLYGPGDSFDLKTSHVIPALIRKVQYAIDNNEKEISVWGTGKPTREFLYVRDCAEGIRLAMETKSSYFGTPINLGNGNEISITELLRTIGELMGYKGGFKWDTCKPDGQPRRRLDIKKAEKRFGFTANTPLEIGLQETIDYWNEVKNNA